MDAHGWAEAEKWLVMAFRAAREAALDKAEVKSLRWHVVEASHAHCGGRHNAAAGHHVISELDEVLTTFKQAAGVPGVAKIEDAKRWLRLRGQRGSKAASVLGRLSKCRNGVAHPMVRQLVEEIQQLAAVPIPTSGDSTRSDGPAAGMPSETEVDPCEAVSQLSFAADGSDKGVPTQVIVPDVPAPPHGGPVDRALREVPDVPALLHGGPADRAPREGAARARPGRRPAACGPQVIVRDGPAPLPGHGPAACVSADVNGSDDKGVFYFKADTKSKSGSSELGDDLVGDVSQGKDEEVAIIEKKLREVPDYDHPDYLEKRTAFLLAEASLVVPKSSEYDRTNTESRTKEALQSPMGAGRDKMPPGGKAKSKGNHPCDRPAAA